MTIRTLENVVFRINEQQVIFDSDTGCLHPLGLAEFSDVTVNDAHQGDEFDNLYGIGLEFSFGFEPDFIEKLKGAAITLMDIKGKSAQWGRGLILYRYVLGSPLLIYATIPVTPITTTLLIAGARLEDVKGHLRGGLVFNNGMISGFAFGTMSDKQESVKPGPPVPSV